MRTTRWLFTPLLLLIVAQHAAAESPARSELRVISYNMRLSTGADGVNRWSQRRHASLNMIRAERPTVFGVQEALEEQIDYLLDSLPEYEMVGVGREDGESRGEHMAIFYLSEEVELLRWGTFWLSSTPEEPSWGWDAACKRTCTWAEFRVVATGELFAHLNTHLDHEGAVAQREGLRLIVERTREMFPLGRAIVLTGDMNLMPDSEALLQLEGTYEDAVDVALRSDSRGTFNKWGASDSRIDYIFVRNMCAESLTVLRDEDYGAPYISDHFPILLRAHF